jgi:hypothetical protein
VGELEDLHQAGREQSAPHPEQVASANEWLQRSAQKGKLMDTILERHFDTYAKEQERLRASTRPASLPAGWAQRDPPSLACRRAPSRRAPGGT